MLNLCFLVFSISVNDELALQGIYAEMQTMCDRDTRTSKTSLDGCENELILDHLLISCHCCGFAVAECFVTRLVRSCEGGTLQDKIEGFGR